MSLEAAIRITPELRDTLKAIGKKGESYDAIIRRLIEEREARMEAIGWLEGLNKTALDRMDEGP